MPGVGGACRNDLVVIPVMHSKSTIDIYVWFTLSDSLIGLSLKVNHTHCTLSAQKKACCIIKLVGP